MTKKLLTLGILAIILGGIYIPTTTFAQAKCPDGTDPIFEEGVRICDAPANANGTPAGVTATGATPGSVGNEVSFTDFIFGSFFDPLVKGIGYTLMTLSAGILTMVGSLFDFIVEYTIIDMAKNIGDPEGVGGSISAAWRTLRDIANMLFIFVLLYVAFKSMFELDFGSVGKSVKNIIIVALLINFSLFFSKVVIDASNIVSVGFYNSIITANTRSVGTGEGSTGTAGTQTISTGYMRLLGLQSWYSPNILIAPKSMTTQKLLIVGVFSSVFMLITAVVLLISAVMFVARFIILVFLMILSPLALIAIIIPEQGGKFEQWKKALIDQAFFAPVFFALTWVVFKVASTPGFLGQLGASSVAGANAAYIDLITKAPTSSMGLVLNYVLVIGFAIAALVISKQIATRTAGFSAISGGLGAGLIGGAAFAGRQTIGRGAKMLADSSTVRNAASSGKWYSGAARASLWTADKGSKGTFDLRAADTLKKVPGLGKEMDILGKSTNKGGFAAAVDAKAKAKAQYGKDVYGQTTNEKDAAKKLEDKYNIEKFAEENRIKADRINESTRRTSAATTPEEVQAAIQFKKDVDYRNKNKIFKDDEYSDDFKSGIKAEYEKYSKAGEKRQEAFAKRIEDGIVGKVTGVTGSGLASGAVGAAIGGLAGPIGAAIGAGIGTIIGVRTSRQGDKAAARKIRDEIKGPSKEKRLADAYKSIVDTDTDTTTPPPPTPVPGGTPPPTNP